jgi:hypothetical protein
MYLSRIFVKSGFRAINCVALSTSESNHHILVLPPVEINCMPIDSAGITQRIGVFLEDLGLDLEDEQILPFTC